MTNCHCGARNKMRKKKEKREKQMIGGSVAVSHVYSGRTRRLFRPLTTMDNSLTVFCFWSIARTGGGQCSIVSESRLLFFQVQRVGLDVELVIGLAIAIVYFIFNGLIKSFNFKYINDNNEKPS